MRNFYLSEMRPFLRKRSSADRGLAMQTRRMACFQDCAR